jgi:hypothetical protein
VRRGVARILAIVAAPVLLIAAAILGADHYYHRGDGTACASCHEIRRNVELWQVSTHRHVACTECHESTMAGNVRRVVTHLRDMVPERVELRTGDVLRMVARCRQCHRQEFAAWESGPHSATYARIFTKAEQNARQALMDDCLRCHGMHFDGAIRDVVAPVDSIGPWRLLRPELRNAPTMPCLTCHEMHREGKPAAKMEHASVEGPAVPASLGLFDRRERMHFLAASLEIPRVHDGRGPILMSPDPRDGLCYQCHAPRASLEAGSGDDRTPRGVHEGLGCIACHQGHDQSARASCATCHPRLSNCGLNVEKMDTTFASAKSRHNIHSVACSDCHADGRTGHAAPAIRRQLLREAAR